MYVRQKTFDVLKLWELKSYNNMKVKNYKVTAMYLF